MKTGSLRTVDIEKDGDDFTRPQKTLRLDLKKVLGNLLILALILLLLSRTFAFVNGENMATPASVVQGDSMEPTLSEGDMVIWAPVSINSISEGDVIVYQRPNNNHEVVIHRVINVTEVQGRVELTTQGDANEQPDPYPVTEDDLLGRTLSIGNEPFQIPMIGTIWLSMTEAFANMNNNAGGYGFFGTVPILSAGALIIVLVVISPEKDEEEKSELLDKVLGRKKKRLGALKIFIILLLLTSVLVMPSVFLGERTENISIRAEEEGQVSMRNPGFLPTGMYVRAEGEGAEWMEFQEDYTRLEPRSQESQNYTIKPPETAQEGTYDIELKHHHSPFWLIYPDGFVMNTLSSYPEHGPIYLGLLTVLIFSAVALAVIILLSFLIDEIITWWEYHNAKKEINGAKPKKLTLSLPKELTDWIAGVDAVEFTPERPLKASLISLLAFPVALLTAGIWILPIMIVSSVIFTLILGGRWRGEIHTAALVSTSFTVMAIYFVPLLLDIPLSYTAGLPLAMTAAAVTIVLVVLLSPITLILSHLTATTFKRFSSYDFQITDI